MTFGGTRNVRGSLGFVQCSQVDIRKGVVGITGLVVGLVVPTERDYQVYGETVLFRKREFALT